MKLIIRYVILCLPYIMSLHGMEDLEIQKEESITIDVSDSSRKKIDSSAAAKAFKTLIRTNPEFDYLAKDPNLKERLKNFAEKEVKTASGVALIEKVQNLQDSSNSPTRYRTLDAISRPMHMQDIVLQVTKKMHEEEVSAHTETKKELEVTKETVDAKDKEIILKQMEIDSQQRVMWYQFLGVAASSISAVLVAVAAACSTIFVVK